MRWYLSLFFAVVILQILPARPAFAQAQGCWGGRCISNGFISYHGHTMLDPRIGSRRHVPWITILSRWSEYKTQVREHFKIMHSTFHASGVRLLIHTRNPGWGVGIQFPNPSSEELNSLTDIMDTAAAEGLKVFWVFVLPDDYLDRLPQTIDTFYARNNVALEWNLFRFWDAVLPTVLASTGPNGKLRVENLMYIDAFGDFDPLAVYLPLGPAKDLRRLTQQAWFRSIWPNFYAWHTYIPSNKKVFELIGGLNYDEANRVPVNLIPEEIRWVKAELRRYGWPEPSRYAFEAYATQSWANGFSSWFDAYTTLFTQVAAEAGGADRILIEEIGVNTGCGDPTDDGQEGQKTFSASFAALEYLMGTGAISRETPLGVWEFADSPSCGNNGQWGLLRTDGTFKLGWWVLPYFFSK